MSYKVLLTEHVIHDLEDIYDYIEFHDSSESASYVMLNLEDIITTLAENPERGTFPVELKKLGIKDFRELFFKPYRVIYRVVGRKVYVLLIADGRRNMESLLQKRLLLS